MARSRFENLDDEQREEILREAGEEFADKGYESASLNAIIEKAGISKGSLYYYFENKEDLFATVVEHATEMLLSHMTGFSLDDLTEENFWDEIEQLVLEMTDLAAGHRWYFQLARAFYRVSDRQPGSVRDSKLFAFSRRWTRQFLERGQQLGVVRDDLELEYLVEICLGVAEAGDRWILERFEEYDDEQLRREATRQVDVFRRIVEPPESIDMNRN